MCLCFLKCGLSWQERMVFWVFLFRSFQTMVRDPWPGSSVPLCPILPSHVQGHLWKVWWPRPWDSSSIYSFLGKSPALLVPVAGFKIWNVHVPILMWFGLVLDSAPAMKPVRYGRCSMSTVFPCLNRLHPRPPVPGIGSLGCPMQHHSQQAFSTLPPPVFWTSKRIP